MTPLFLTVDFEDSTEAYEINGRHVAMTYRLLSLFRDQQRRATFFTVGRMALSAPDLIREIAHEGHEIAYHSHAHLSLTEESPEIFKRETYVDKDRLEQLTGTSVVGFRAPRFSLGPRTLWATALLRDLGFRYSSSIMPTHLSRFGFVDAPRQPFLWPAGLVEFPLPVYGPRRWGVPFTGGIYLYLSPFWLVAKRAAALTPAHAPWTYMHPYDLDTERRFKNMPNTPLWVRLLLSLAGLRAPAQIRRLLTLCGTSPQTLGERAADPAFYEALKTFPESGAA
jgi:polysaccharide deacetylase family protein (PEP-CTERM system associated)